MIARWCPARIRGWGRPTSKIGSPGRGRLSDVRPPRLGTGSRPRPTCGTSDCMSGKAAENPSLTTHRDAADRVPAATATDREATLDLLSQDRGAAAREEVAHRRRDLPGVGLEREVTRVEELDRRPGNVASERLGAARQEEGIVLPPYRQEGRLVRPEVVLEGRIERDVALVVAEEVQLDLVGAAAGQIEVVE